MARPSVVTAQTDFSAGEIDAEAKRLDNSPVQKAGLRRCENWRILDAKAISNRPGRKAILADSGRCDQVELAPGHKFYMVFGQNTIAFYSSDFILRQAVGGMPWLPTTVKNIVWAVFQQVIYITFPGVRPITVTWDGALGFTVGTYTEGSVVNQKRTVFYRIAPKGITLLPSAATGAITLTTSAAYFSAAMINTHRLRYQGRQILITGVTNPTTAAGTVQETLLGGQQLTFASTPPFNVGDQVEGSISGATGQVTAVGATTIDVTLLDIPVFQQSDVVVGPTGSMAQSAAPTSISPPASVVWDEEIMNTFRGFPESVFVDQNRLGFCNFPALPRGIAWSSVANPTDLYPGALATDAIFELVPGQSQVFFVMPGPESNEIVFCNDRIYYIPIGTGNPLKPGSVAFNQVSTSGILRVEPRAIEELIAFVDSGGLTLSGLFVFGGYNRPYRVQPLSQLNDHLFDNPIAIALPSASPLFPERYVYVLNDNGQVVLGKYTLDGGQISSGFLRWTGSAFVTWVAAAGGDVLFTAQYAPNGIVPVNVVEVVATDVYLDAAIAVNAPPTGMQTGNAAGTNIGNMTQDGGLAAAFNGNRLQAKSSCATLATSSGFIGRAWTTPQTLFALVWPSTDQGFTIGGTGDITLELRGSQAAPASASDGTLLATVTLAADQVTGPVALVPEVYSATKWAYGFIVIRRTAATSVICSQLIIETGALWLFKNATVELMDLGTRMMGIYQVDADGQIVPQGLGGENLQSVQLVAGQKWTARAEPFIPAVPPGQDVAQRMWARRVTQFKVYVKDSTGFMFQRLFSGPLRPDGPVLGATVNFRRIPAWNQGDDALQPPPLREQAYGWRPLGRSYDPRIEIFKDTPGPLIVMEMSTEVTV